MPVATAAGAASPLLQLVDLFEGLAGPLAELLGYVLLSAGTTGALALVYRWYFRERLPDGVAALVGVSVVTVTVQADQLQAGQLLKLSELIGGGPQTVFELGTVLVYVTALAAALSAAPVGVRVGDAAAKNLFSVSAVRDLEGDFGTVVRSVGRVVAVDLPEEVRDMESHDPVPASTKDELAGKTLLFPRRLTHAELRDRLTTRLKRDYGIGYVDVEFAADGRIEYLAVGSRLLGVGPTLAPGTAAVALRADPPAGASPGDVVQVWTARPNPERLLTAELRGIAGDVVTLAVDEADAPEIGGEGRYRLVTLPTEPRVDREFASLLRAADETMGAVRVAAGSPLDGETLAAVGVTVVALKPPDGSVTAIPPQSRALAAGDTLYVVARPEAIRRLESEASADGHDGGGNGTSGNEGGGEVGSDDGNADEEEGDGRRIDEGGNDDEGADAAGAGEAQPSTPRPDE